MFINKKSLDKSIPQNHLQLTFCDRKTRLKIDEFNLKPAKDFATFKEPCHAANMWKSCSLKKMWLHLHGSGRWSTLASSICNRCLRFLFILYNHVQENLSWWVEIGFEQSMVTWCYLVQKPHQQVVEKHHGAIRHDPVTAQFSRSLDQYKINHTHWHLKPYS